MKNHWIQTGGNFEDLVTESTIFIDKSLFIKEALEDQSKVILITMPRRWGKSLNLDILKRFLSIEESNLEQKNINQKIFQHAIKANLDGTRSQLDIITHELKVKDEDNINQLMVYYRNMLKTAMMVIEDYSEITTHLSLFIWRKLNSFLLILIRWDMTIQKTK